MTANTPSRPSVGRRLIQFARKRKLLTAGLLVFLGFLPTPLIIAGRTMANHPGREPLPRAGKVVAEIQTEPHTCGLHAVSSLYRAYGLDPEAERVRFRLGVDVKAVFWMEDSTGTLPPDLYMVLSQDHFRLDTVDLESRGAWSAVSEHVASGQLAILLIVRKETGGLHWVVAGSGAETEIAVYDSLRADAPAAVSEPFFQAQVVSAVLVRPAGSVRVLTSTEAHKMGADELLRVQGRLKERKPIGPA